MQWRAENLDQFGMTPELKIFGKKRYQTHFGAFITIITGAAVFALSLYFIAAFYMRKELSIFSQTAKSSLDVSFNIHSMPFMFKLYNLLDGKSIDSKLLSFSLYKYDDFNDGNKAIITPMRSEVCLNSSWDSAYNSVIDQTDVPNFHCISQNQTDLLNITYTDKRTSIVILAVRFCQNTTENGNSCYSVDAIKRKLSGVTLYSKIMFPDFSIDHSDFSAPVKITTYKHTMKIDPTSTFTLMRYYFKSFQYISDQGAIFENLQTWNQFGPDPTLFTLTNTPIGGTPFVITDAVSAFTMFNTLNTQDKIKRSYPKMQSLVASIGGVLSALSFIAKSIVIYVSKQMAYAEILEVVTSINNHLSKPQVQQIASSITRSIEPTDTKNDYVKVGNFVFPSKNQARGTERLTLFDALLPKCCSKSILKKNSNAFAKIIDDNLSVEVLLKALLTDKTPDTSDTQTTRKFNMLFDVSKSTSKLTKIKEIKNS